MAGVRDDDIIRPKRRSIRGRYLGCAKWKVFKFFDGGFRPSELYTDEGVMTELKLKKSTIFTYHQEWKKNTMRG